MNRTTVGGPELGGGRGSGGVVVLSGRPGAGEDAVAPLLAEALHPGAHLRAEDFRQAIRRGHVEPHLPEARRQNETVLTATAQAAFAYASGGYQVVVEGPIAPSDLAAFRRESRATGAPLHYVLLCPEPAQEDSRPTGERPFGGLGALERHELPVDPAGDAAATAKTVLEGLLRGAYLLGW
ncbi:ATP-binding protein [Kitasatospora sp. NPDC052868]|uniref:ATP-binding protein n=1 Tax=Kitasatospora sp. NPDC052868 TaxID=3364060 RepID=UPI0037C59ACD